jgi:hypothetical protein
VSPVDPERWSFIIPNPAGDVHVTYQLTPDALAFDSDALWNGGQVAVPWTAILEAGTTTLGMPVGRGAPDLGRYVPAKLEWLVASRRDKTGAPFMGHLPPSPDREALIAAVRMQVGGRWIGESIPFVEAQKRFGLPSGGSENLKAAGIVIGVLALLALLLVVMVILLSPIFLFPAGFIFGGWLFRSGLSGYRDAIAIANTPTSRVASAAIGLVELEGRATAAQPTRAPVTGRPSVFWDFGVDAYSSNDDSSGWSQLAARHGGAIDVLHLEDQTGRVPVWLKDADMLLATDSWEMGKDQLPAAGVAFLDDLGFPWNAGDRTLRVRETRLEVDSPVYVIGTLGERRTLPAPGERGMVATVVSQFRTGQWRTSLIRMLPPVLGRLVAVLFGFLSIVLGVGRGGERPTEGPEPKPPDLPPDAVLVWKGSAGRPFIVSNRHETQAVEQLRTRSLYKAGGGIVIVCYVLYELLKLLF